MSKRFFLLGAILLGFSTLAHADSDYVKSVEKWRADEAADLTKADGWLSLAGLFWLKEGTNSVGAGTEYDVRLTDNFKQGRFGEIELKDGTATLKVAPGIAATSQGQPVSEMVLISDAKGKPTPIQIGSQTFYLIQREDRFGIRLKDSQSKTRLTFKGQTWFPVDDNYRVTAKLEAYPEPRELMIPNVLGGHFKMKSPGILKFTLMGKECSLQPVNNNDGSLFIIFRDASNVAETYDAGRFLDAEKPVNGATVLDFNKAENPPCAFTPYATCPLAPSGNELPIPVDVGEKRYQP